MGVLPEVDVVKLQELIMHIIRDLQPKDGPTVLKIYQEGIQSGVATFETTAPNWETFDKKYLSTCRFVMEKEEQVIGWATLSAISRREVYRGVAEVSIYIDKEHHRKGLGKQLLQHLISKSEEKGFWTLQANIFSENMGSIRLHEQTGFRQVGIREKIAQRNGEWKDNVLLERRSSLV